MVKISNNNFLAEKNGIKFLETSAKDTVNIEELFTFTTKSFLEKQCNVGVKNQKKTPGNSVTLNSNTNHNNSTHEGGCC